MAWQVKRTLSPVASEFEFEEDTGRIRYAHLAGKMKKKFDLEGFLFAAVVGTNIAIFTGIGCIFWSCRF